MKRLILFFISFMVICCKSERKTTTISEKKPEITTEQTTKNTEEVKYVTAKSGLIYRDKPKGERLGKVDFNSKLSITEHTNVFQEIKNNGKTIKGEWLGTKINGKTVYIFDGFLSESLSFEDIWGKFPLKNKPFIENTNFDNYKKVDKLNEKEILTLQLDKIYPNFKKQECIFYPMYQLKFRNLDDNYQVIVVRVETEHEMTTILIPYENKKIIEFSTDKGYKINYTIIAYDEIAEGWSKTTSIIKNNCITTIDALYIEPPKIDTILYHINQNGIINKVDTKFGNHKIGKIYTDTITFIKYNNDYDYSFIEGIKNETKVTYIYNWEINEKNNFKKNDLVKLNYKIDSMYIAGDGETLQFSEIAINGEKIK